MMDFSEALVLLKAGKPMARQEWLDHYYSYPNRGCIKFDADEGEIVEYGTDGDGSVTFWDTEHLYDVDQNDILAEDWIDLTEEPAFEMDEIEYAAYLEAVAKLESEVK